MAVDANGNVYVAGYEYRSDLKQDYNSWLRKYDSAGNEIWTRTYDSPAHEDDRFHAVAIDSLGAAYVAGREDRGDLGEQRNVFVRKYGSDGSVIWTQTHNGSQNRRDHAEGVAVDGNNNVYVAGRHWPSTFSDAWLRKYTPDGGTLWTSTYNAPGNSSERWESVATDAAGNVYLVGWEDRYDLGEHVNVLLRKYDPDGNDLWTQSYNSPADAEDRGYGVAVDALGNVYAAGYEVRDDQGEGWNAWLAKYDTDGNPLWTRTHNSPGGGDDMLYSVAIGPSGDLYAVGYEDRSDIGQGSNICLRAYDTDGNPLWTQTYNSELNGFDYGYDLAFGPGGSLYVTGLVGMQTAGEGQNIVLLKFQPVPEPLSMAFMGSAFVGVVAWRVRKRRRRAKKNAAA